MASRYATVIPNDSAGNPIQGAAVFQPAIVTNLSENATASSVITVNDNTTDLEVAAVGATGFIKWIGRGDTTASVVSSVGGANWDVVIPSGTVRRLVIPRETQGTSSIVGANIANGLYNRVAWKTGGPGSILATQY
jgi:hypothetical protein